MENYYQENNTAAFTIFSKINFVISLVAISVGIYLLEVSLVTKGFFALAAAYLFTTTVILSKTLRDEHESKKIINRMEEAKAQKLLKDYEN